MAALTGKLFSDWRLNGPSQGCTSAAGRGAGCRKCSAGMKQGSEVRACCLSHMNTWGCLRSHCTVPLHRGFGYTSMIERAHWPHPALPRTHVLSCRPAWMLARTELSPQNLAPAISPNYISDQTLCGFLTAFFASKLEHESKHCNGKGFQRPGSSAFDRVYTAK